MSTLPSLQKRDDWKKEPWLLLVLGGPFSVVCASLFSGYLAFSGADKVVTEDYYKQGLMINTDLMRDAEARRLNLQASLNLQPDGQIRLTMQGNGRLSDTILLSVAASNESQLVETTHRLPLLMTTPGVYQGKLSSLNSPLLHIKLEGNNWRLTSDWHNPLRTELKIRAANN